MGVWIETEQKEVYGKMHQSHPSWVCGLKQTNFAYGIVQPMSHPSWVCGLKHYEGGSGIMENESHPSWVCGLKLEAYFLAAIGDEVTPFVGVWIETLSQQTTTKQPYVTPFVGVWIET